MGELLDMDVLSCPLYDGMSAAATSLRMASRVNGRKEVLLPKSISPDMLLVIKNYLNGVPEPQLDITLVNFDAETGLLDLKDLMFGITETVKEGEWGFGEVLFDRTSYGSREKGKEFTGTTTGLWAITTGVYLALMGPKGMEEIGQTIMQKSQYAAKRISQIKGVKLVFNTPFFKEFVVNFDATGKSVSEINKALLGHKIFGGKDISNEFAEFAQSGIRR